MKSPLGLVGPALGVLSERAQRINADAIARRFGEPDRRIYRVTVTNGTAGTEVRHDLRQALIPQVTALGLNNRVAVLSIESGAAVLRNVGAAVECDCVVTFEIPDRLP